MKLADVKRYYKSTQGIYLSDSGGRRVVDKMADLSLNRAHAEWSGTDRPEYTDFGAAKVCVEAERTCFLPYSDDFSQWLIADSADITASDLADPKGGNTAYRVSYPISASRFYYNIAQNEGGTYTLSVWAKRNSSSTPPYEFRLWVTRIDEDSISKTFAVTEDWKKYSFTFTAENGVIAVQVRNQNIGSIDIWRANLIEGAYPTLDIPTSGAPVTRIAPTVPIEDALPETGTVAGVVDMVRDPDVNQYIFDGGDTTSTNRSRLFITNAGNLQTAIHGSAGGQIITPFPFSISNYERFVMKWAISCDYETIRLFVQAGDEKYLFTNAHSVNDSSNRTVMIGSSREGSIHTSIYFKSLHRDSIVRTTEEEFEQLFEVIS